MKSSLLVVIIIGSHFLTTGQDLSPSKTKSVLLDCARQDILHSKMLNKDCKVNIYLPESFQDASDDHVYPVLVLLEDEFFHMVTGVVRHLGSVERMPETIVVSILDMYYMPTVFTNGSTFWPMKQLSDEDPGPFTRYLNEELFPYLKSNYRASDFKMVMGLSSTSVYTLHTFVKEPGLFNAHIAIAAGDILGMGYSEGRRFIEDLSDVVTNSPEVSRYLYVVSADSDTDGYPEIAENLEALEHALAPLRSRHFRFVSKVFPEEGHYDVALPALLEAMELIFPKKEWSAKYRELVSKPGKAMVNIDGHFQEISDRYGFPVLPRADRWNSVNRLSWIGPYLIRQGRVTEGIEILERWVKYRPGSAFALRELANAYDVNNQSSRAAATMTRAYQLAKQNSYPDVEEYRLRLEELKGKIK